MGLVVIVAYKGGGSMVLLTCLVSLQHQSTGNLIVTLPWDAFPPSENVRTVDPLSSWHCMQQS